MLGIPCSSSARRGNASIGAWLEAQAGEGYNFIAYGADVADHASCQSMAGLIQADGHHIDILVINAGITRDAERSAS